MASGSVVDLSNSKDSEEELISHEEVEMWSVSNLQEYCERRGYHKTGSKKVLVSRVYMLYNNNVAELPGRREQDISRKKDYKSLVNSAYPATDPTKLQKWLGEKEGLRLWPPVSYLDIHWFFQQNGSAGLSKEQLTAYKTGKAYSYFQCNWLKEVFYSPLSKAHKCCFLKAKCTPSNRVNDVPHNLWVKIIKESGDIVSAYCTCVAGLNQTCNHVAALLFKIDHAHKLGLSNPACTTTENQWAEPSGAKINLNIRLQQMSFIKPDYAKGKVPTSIPLPIQNLCKVRDTLVKESDPSFYKNFISSIRDVMPNASLFLPGRKRPQTTAIEMNIANSKEDSNKDDCNVAAGEPSAGDHALETAVPSASIPQLPACSDVNELAKSCLDVNQLLDRMKLTDTAIHDIEVLTRGQKENPLWFQARKGRVTASRFYTVFTKIETMKKKSTTTCESLIDSFLFPTVLDHISHIQRGAMLEDKALQSLLQRLGEDGHKNVRAKPLAKQCGLFVDKTDTFLGARPDGIIECDCCEPRLVEIKCPTKDLLAYTHIDGQTKKLKKRDIYYGQVQGQMMVAGFQSTWFFAFFGDQHENHLELIPHDQKFCEKMRKNLCMFYRLHLAPQILLGRKRKHE